MTKMSPYLLNIRKAVDGIVCLQHRKRVHQAGSRCQEMEVKGTGILTRVFLVFSVFSAKVTARTRLRNKIRSWRRERQSDVSSRAKKKMHIKAKRWPEEWADLSPTDSGQ